MGVTKTRTVSVGVKTVYLNRDGVSERPKRKNIENMQFLGFVRCLFKPERHKNLYYFH